jgi:phospholipid/cholesterol/gamma-HCH transport system ATP-binding protein
MEPIAAEEPIIAVEDLVAAYGEQRVLGGLSFEVHRGEVFFVVGESGCGKSTLLKNLVGLHPPEGGRIRVCGVDIGTASDGELEQVRTRLGVLFQGGALLGSLTVGENVALPLLRHLQAPPELLERIVRMKLAMVNLAGYENHMPAELSGGMKNRVGLARAFALDPLVLLLDEPTSGLDPINAGEIDELIARFNRSLGTTMVIVSQDMRSVFSIGQRVMLLDKDRRGIAAIGSPEELRAHPPTPFAARFFQRSPA